MSSPVNTRRWPRHPVELPVRVFPRSGDSKLTFQGRGIEMSEGGMTLYAGVPLKPGDLMDIEFQTPGGARIAAIVRNRMGFCFGLEFLTPLSGESPKRVAVRRPAPAERNQAPIDRNPTPAEGGDVRAVLRRKEIEMERLRQEIATLRTFGKSTT
jgi:hypothetical protein